MKDNIKIRIIGILAHVDAGKTTLTENLLFQAKAIKQLGSVDNGTSQTDWLDIEKERGISVRASDTSFLWEGYTINIIDTPGHVDFSSEVERSLTILDGAVLVVSAVDGIQPQTEVLIEALQKLKTPFLIFVNKTDRAGSDTEAVLQELETDFSLKTFYPFELKNEENADVALSNLWDESMYSAQPELIEKIAECNEGLLERYLEDEKFSFAELNDALKSATQRQLLAQVIPGSAKTGVGIEDLLRAIIDFLPAPSGKIDGELSGIVYKIMHDKNIGRLAGVRLFGGSLKVRDSVSSNGKEEKVSQLRKYTGQNFTQIDKLEAGEMAYVAGLFSFGVGDIIGERPPQFQPFQFDAPLLTIQVFTTNEADYPTLAEALQILSIEDPLLDFDWLREEKELHIKIRGTIQLEVLERLLEQRFQVKSEFGKPTVIYKETIAKPGYGYEAYTMPKPCWAVVKFLIEPGERGSGVAYQSKVSVNKIRQRYQNEVERTIPKALKQGIKGWEVTDVKITLVGEEDHQVHSNPGDFILATPIGIMKGLEEAGTTLLEPLLHFKITAPEDTLGKIAADLHKMRATFGNPQFENGKVKLTGEVPLSTSLDYAIRLGSVTGGKGKFSTRFSGYQAIPDELGETRPFKGISPLDRSKYILKMRGAITE
ncbi:MAG: TetM/TetW/TetO/TetS family tetracycline resistance ribosomal protection protein [Bacteroidales bacterium]|nr:TetM/TetW/TetO/TetS family tetracycline resistance ribosomal protection protein [Bacteroidales bacterium]MCF8457184.1 TetM/TetW/TetO/TetS family tetracycline resistance ribosomal protection protein [Bacteroidales bacterium]